MSPSRGALRRVALAIMRVAALWAPASERSRMAREWEAELEREFGMGGRWEVVRAAFGAFADAHALRRLEKDRGREDRQGRVAPSVDR